MVDTKKLQKLVSEAARIESKMQNSVLSEPKDGYRENRYGTYYKVAEYENVLALLNEAIDLMPEEDYFRYLRAGTYLYGALYDEAAVDYQAVIEGGTQYADHALAMMVSVHLARAERAQAEAALEQYNDRMKKKGKAFMVKSMSQYEAQG